MKDSFVVRFGVSLWLTSIGISGPFGAILGAIVSALLGSLLDRGILILDLSIDSLRLALQESQWKDAAAKAYAHATARVYTDEEKNAIRKEYLDALEQFARVGVLRDPS